MTGYLEILTDPSYSGQVVVMTTPHIGNYGVAGFDEQSTQPHISGLVVRALSRRDSNFRSEATLGDFLKERGVVALSDVDTRRLTRHIRDRGAMPVAIGVDVTESELRDAAENAPEMLGADLASGVSTREPYRISADGAALGLVVAIDLGMKKDIGRHLAASGYDVEVVPHDEGAASILERAPVGVFVSNGPGDPEPLTATVETLQGLIGEVPLFGICLGHQVLGLALGATTYKLPFGHHGGNHPVRRLDDGRVEITSQNHGFAVDLWSLTADRPPDRLGMVSPGMLPDGVDTAFGPLEPTHQNLNDGTLEGMRLTDAPAFSVQYHPEAAPGPRDARGLFADFSELIGEST
jgi:carbamoyl-phosphate synthase small subunit